MENNINFANAFRTLPGAFVLLSPELEVLDVTENYLSRLGKTINEVIGLFIFDLHPEHPKFLDDQNLTSNYSIIFHKGGAVKYIIFRPDDLLIENVSFQSFDEKTLNDLPQLIWLANSERRITFLNRYWCHTTGVSSLDNPQKNWESVIHPEDLVTVLEVWKKVELLNKQLEIECRLYCVSQGLYRWHLMRAIPQRKTGNREVYEWFGTCTDIDEQRRTRDYLEASGEKFKLITEAIPQMVWRANANGSADYCNQRFLDYIGCSIDKTLGWGWIDLVHEDDREELVKHWTEVLKRQDSIRHEFRVRLANGQYRWIVSVGCPFRDRNGVVTKYFGTWTEIEDTKQALREAELAVQSKSAFLANMSHEILSFNSTGG